MGHRKLKSEIIDGIRWKECSKCGEYKPEYEYYRASNLTAPYGLQSRCKICSNQRVRQSRAGERKWQLKYKFNLTLDEYEVLLKAQNGVCAICNWTPIKFLFVDHDHLTNKVRGLLCPTCNSGLGYFKDNIDVLQAAIDYLKKHSSQ